MTVHDVDMDVIGAGVGDGFDFASQIDRVIHVRIIEWVCIGFYRKEERLHLSLFHPQRLCLYDDRGQGYWSEDLWSHLSADNPEW